MVCIQDDRNATQDINNSLEFTSRYEIAHTDSLVFVKDIRSEINKLSRIDNNPNNLDKIMEDIKTHLCGFYYLSLPNRQAGDCIFIWGTTNYSNIFTR